MTPDHDHPKPDPTALAPTPRRSGPRREHLCSRSGRFLDPGTAIRFADEQLATTAYAGDTLLFRPSGDEQSDHEVIDILAQAAEKQGYTVTGDAQDAALLRLAREAGVDLHGPQPLILRVRLQRIDDGRPRPAPDCWPVLQTFRWRLRDDRRRYAVQLEHLLTTTGHIQPAPYVAYGVGANSYVAYAAAPNPYVAYPYVAYAPSTTPASATAEYAQPGWGGRTPVVWVGPRPHRRRDDELGGSRRPVVAVLDTGTGIHPWLDDDLVDRAPTCGPLRIGLTDPDTDIERKGVLSGELTGSLDIDAGHGTFIAGLVHQRCPDARILSVRVVQPDGVVNEYDLIQALNMLWVRQSLALARGRTDELVDVVSISLGYYHEKLSDARFDPLMLAPLRALTRLGVAVVASAGNDATRRPCYPAAFAPYAGGVVSTTPAGELPVVAVGATNPDGSTALFSNNGPWVRAWRPGAGLISTMPTTFDAGREPTVQVVQDGVVRATIDPDDFRSGFAAWSGTSFAAPIVAGDLAQCLNEDESLVSDPGAVEDPVGRAWRALRRAVPEVEESR